jgi:hypothetical protein
MDETISVAGLADKIRRKKAGKFSLKSVAKGMNHI